MRLSHADIMARIPHAGSMCLLQEVRAWDDTGITCMADNHRDTHHPLRHQGRLMTLCGIEYAAQAMALHGSLMDGQAQKEGYLVTIRQVQSHVPYLDAIEGELEIHAEILHDMADSSRYRFFLYSTAGEAVLEGQATVLIREKGEIT